MQKLLLDHMQAVKTDAAGRPLTRAQRKFLIENVRTDFAASVFAKVRVICRNVGVETKVEVEIIRPARAARASISRVRVS